MQRSKLSIIFTIIAALLLATPASHALVKKPSAKAGKSASQSKSAKSKSKTKKTAKGKKAPYILTPAPEIVAPEAAHTHQFSPEFNDALARGELRQAYRDLQLEPASDKVGYMINQVGMAMGNSGSHGYKLSSFDRAVAWHNLYLFLARQGRPAPKFVKEAAKYYQKAARKAETADKADVLLAALYATAGDVSKSVKYFGKVDVSDLTRNGEDYNGLEYLATYYAATKQPDKAITYLDQAYKLNPGSLLQWLHVGDDFGAIEDDAVFQDQVKKWTTLHHDRLVQLQRDKQSHDVRKKAALTKKSKKKVTSSPRKRGSKK
jgi:tetratricopeptide (TPR) repeat protein